MVSGWGQAGHSAGCQHGVWETTGRQCYSIPCQVPELRTFSRDELGEYSVRTRGGGAVGRAPWVHRPVWEGLELHPQGEDPRQEVGLVALRHLLRLSSGPLRKAGLLPFRITCRHSKNAGQQQPPWGQRPCSTDAFWLPAPTPPSDQLQSWLHLYNCLCRHTQASPLGSETLLSFPSREGPSHPGDSTQAGSSPCCQKLLSALLELERHVLGATGAGAGTPESQSPGTSARTSQMPDRAHGNRRETAEQV